MDSTAPPRDGTPAPWPDGTRCPLCLAHDVSASSFHFEIEKAAAERWVTVRCRCCDECRRRVQSLGFLRAAVLPVVVLGTLAWPLLIVSSLPMRMLALSRLESIMISTLLCAVVVGIPLLFVDRANRSLRRNLETSWLFRRVRARVRPAAAPSADAAPNDHWKVLADPPASAVVVEATDLLRSETL
ncbi:MAG: hypothetical protein JWO86_6434 [Myxococcaceae bacterium]|nr:hypothetical protein [Myxococcaceae bacterium]MEA2749558.1 hypothetical protein [Myxococcales bacterium]